MSLTWHSSSIIAMAPSGGHHAPESGAAFDLTRREREILMLLVQRPTNSEIADVLFISPRTVGSHIEHLLAKLGAANRREAAAIAARHGLV